MATHIQETVTHNEATIILAALQAEEAHLLNSEQKVAEEADQLAAIEQKVQSLRSALIVLGFEF